MGLFSKSKATKKLYALVSHPGYAAEVTADEAGVFIRQGADVNAYLLGTRPLCEAAVWGNLDVATVLLDNGADLHGRESNGWTPLHIAALNDHEKMIRFLLERRADPNATGHRRETPLHLTIAGHRIRAAGILLDAGANPNLADSDGRTPFQELHNVRETWRRMPTGSHRSQSELQEINDVLLNFDSLMRRHGAI